MSDDNNTLGFGKFVPGFDFLQNLAKGASQAMPQMPNLSSWVAPTLDVEELDKRINDLKAVQFWLDQNAKALGATIQALEVQKMTLSTLQGMNLKMAEVADAMKLTPQPPKKAAPAKSADKPADKPADRTADGKDASSDKPPVGVVDPLQWWGALTQQFQQIAATAMKDVAAQTAMGTSQPKAAAAKPPAKAARKTAARRGAKTGAKKSAAH